MNSKKIITNKRSSVKAQALQRSILPPQSTPFQYLLFILFQVFYPPT